MDKSTLILWGSVGAAALLVVVVVGFVIPVGEDGSSVQPAGPGGGSVARPENPRPRPMPVDRTELSPEDAAADRQRRAEMREKWANMTEEEREAFRQQMRKELIESARRGDAAQRREDAAEQKRREDLTKRRQGVTTEVKVDSPDQTP